MKANLEAHSKEVEKWYLAWACMSMLLEDDDMWHSPHHCGIILLSMWAFCLGEPHQCFILVFFLENKMDLDSTNQYFIIEEIEL